jgi:hypothetical protein
MRPSDDPFGTFERLDSVQIRGVLVRPGSPVVLRPQGRADIMDLALRGRTAVVESLEVDFEGTIHVAVVVDGDPGRDLGRLRQTGHRFFFRAEEVEPVSGPAGETR